LLGWSNGVPDVLTYVAQYGTATLRGVVLVDGLINLSDPQLQKALGGMLQLLQTDRRKFTDGFVRGMYASKQSEEYLAHVKEQSLKTPTNTAITLMYNVLSKGDFTPALARLDKPVIYICEERLASQGKLLQASLPRARVEVMKNAAHALFVDDAALFNQKVTEFMDSLPALPPN
jgi:microsomal epoxide hydrolase